MRFLKKTAMFCVVMIFMLAVGGRKTFVLAQVSYTEQEPYLIETLEELMIFADEVNGGKTFEDKYIRLENNIDLSSISDWMPIGNTEKNSFRGTFDGNGQVISNLSIQNKTITNTKKYAGLFGYADKGEIKNLVIENCNIAGTDNVGGVAGFAASIAQCSVTGTIKGTGEKIGGVAGTAAYINNCTNASKVIGKKYVGGIAGICDGDMVECNNTGSVEGTSNTGGIVGKADGNIMFCSNDGSVAGEIVTGGIAGLQGWEGMVGCYNTADISGSSDTGGIVGLGLGVFGCYNSGTITGSGRAVGGIGGTLKYVFECYNVGNIEGTGNKVGGIAGLLINGAAEKCVALNAYTNGYDANRVIGINSGSNPIVNCYGWEGTKVNGETVFGSVNDENGENVSYDKEKGFVKDFQSNWGILVTDEGEISYDYWVESNPQRLPILQGIEGQINAVPEYIQNFDKKGVKLSQQETVYKIQNKQELFAFAKRVNLGDSFKNKTVSLEADIDLKGEQWTPIGNGFNVGFQGIFEGNGHILKNLSIQSEESYQGLFGVAWGDCVIRNLGLENCTISGNTFIGGIAGYGGKIENCYTTGIISGRGEIVGGIAGRVDYMENCYSTADVAGQNRVGGLAGFLIYDAVNCVALNISITASGTDVRTIANSGVEIINCWYAESARSACQNIYNIGSFLVSEEQILDEKWWKTTVDFSAPWILEKGKYPHF